MHARFREHVYPVRSHDSYSFGITDAGAQRFRCRGAAHTSGAGMVMAFNPERGARRAEGRRDRLPVPHRASRARTGAPRARRHLVQTLRGHRAEPGLSDGDRRLHPARRPRPGDDSGPAGAVPARERGPGCGAPASTRPWPAPSAAFVIRRPRIAWVAGGPASSRQGPCCSSSWAKPSGMLHAMRVIGIGATRTKVPVHHDSVTSRQLGCREGTLSYRTSRIKSPARCSRCR
ncbi:AraC family ligand binding domain-containing protein [Actinacidiphila paucisporea]|uniref:AraC family ligand binding domain-containing protein n=1 Tax=Actinacidiphila paucisporea TaxID=310782 RepID=UPI002AFE7830|nr:AraC family ligand binding domain-containing protein [Actinacidiphila paucisporea]